MKLEDDIAPSEAPPPHARKVYVQGSRPDIQVPPNARFVIEDEKQFPGFNPRYLFDNGLEVITPLLWLLFALNLMGYFFLLSWTPTLQPPGRSASPGPSNSIAPAPGARSIRSPLTSVVHWQHCSPSAA